MDGIKSQDLGKTITAQFEAHRTERNILEVYWQDAFRFTLPHRGQQFLKGSNDPYSDASSARKDQATIFDSTAIDAVRLLSSSIISGLTPASMKWFSLEVDGMSIEDVPVDGAEWLEKASANLFKMIHSSNYNATAFEFFQDVAIGGMVGLFIDKPDGGDFLFEVWPLGGLYVSETLRKGKIDTVYRLLKLTATEAVEKFGKNNVPQSVKTALDKPTSNTQIFDFVHCIKPRMVKGKQSKGKLSKQLPFESVYVHKETSMVVKESGFEEFPCVIPRWSMIPDTPYALGPLNDALPDVKTINRVVEMMLTNAEMAIAGTYVATHDGIINPNTVRIGPRRVIFAADAKNIQPLATGGNFQIAFTEIERLQRQIKSVMMADELAPIEKNYASATEVAERTQIIRQILGPVYARLQSEFLQPLLGRCFGLAVRDGSLGQPPQSISGAPITPDYTSPMARAQKYEEVTAMDSFEVALANMAQIDPSVLDLYNVDAAYRRRAALIAVPIDVMNTKEQVTMKRKQQQEAQAAQQEAELAAQPQ